MHGCWCGVWVLCFCVGVCVSVGCWTAQYVYIVCLEWMYLDFSETIPWLDSPTAIAYGRETGCGRRGTEQRAHLQDGWMTGAKR